MARKYGRYHCGIWSDPDYQSLDPYHQGIFAALIAYPDISWCGVIDYMPKRLIRCSDHLSVETLDLALKFLAHGYFLIIDEETEEILVRTFIRWDGVMHQKNVGKAMVTALRKVKSQLIKDAIITELVLLRRCEPDVKGWEGVEELAPNLFEGICVYADDPSWKPYGGPE